MGKPKIRFRGYTEDWEQRKLGDALISLQNNTLSRADLSNETGIAKNVHYGDVLIKFGEVLDVSKEKLPMISDESVLSKYKASFLQNGDVIVADTAEDLTVGKCSEIAGLNDEVVLSGLHTIPYRPIERFAAGYLGYYLNSSAYHNQLIPLMQGIKVTSISKSAMQDTDIVYPKSVEEQGKIGNYFQSLDNLITLHQRKCEETKKLKKYMLQKMFPRNGQKVPEIRFSGFTEDWEQRKLDDIVEFLDTMRKPLEGAKRVSGPYPYYGASGIVDYVDGYLFDEELILLSEDGANITDRNYPVCFLASGKYWVNNHAHVLRSKQENENNFICISLERKDYTQYNTGMAMPKLNKETCRKIPVLCPTFEEQQKIGDYFRSLDNLITLHQRKCDELQNIKKYMLQNMFV